MVSIANSVFFPPADRLEDIPAGYSIKRFSIMFVPLLKVRLGKTQTILMRPSLHAGKGFDIAHWVYSWDAAGEMDLPRFEDIRAGIRNLMAGFKDQEFKSWKNTLKAYLSSVIPDVRFSLSDLSRELLLDFGKQHASSDLVIHYHPFSVPASVVYLEQSSRSGENELVSAHFLGLEITTDDLSFLESQDLELVPLEFLKSPGDLHRRYTLHPSVAGFFEQFPPFSGTANEIPCLDWTPEGHAEDLLVFSADFSFYYENASDPDLLRNAISLPNPASEEETMLHAFNELESAMGPGEAFASGFKRILESFLMRAFLKGGFFVDSPTAGIFAGLTDTLSLRLETGNYRLYSIQPLEGLCAFLPRMEVILDRRRIDCVGPAYNDPARWFNLGRDRIPFDIRSMLRLCHSNLQNASVPPEAGDKPSGYRRTGLYLTSEGYEFFKPCLLPLEMDGTQAHEMEEGKSYLISTDDSLLGYLIPGIGREGKPSMVIWRRI